MSGKEDMKSAIWNSDGTIKSDVQNRIDQAIREFPNQDAPQWLGGTVAIVEISKILGIYPEDEE